MSDEITLLCWVQGDKIEQGFLIPIKPSATVHSLKKAIQEKLTFQQVKINHYDSDLQVWKVGGLRRSLDRSNYLRKLSTRMKRIASSSTKVRS